MDSSVGPAKAAAPTAGDVAREVNAQIRAIAESLAANGEEDDEENYTFFCECGCLHTVTLTLADFLVARAAFVAGHKTAAPR
jgi:hypothetical protein